MDFETYELENAFYDEMFLPDGTPRDHCRYLYEALLRLPVEELVRMQERVNHSFSSKGITFTVYGDEVANERIMPVDCLPRIISASEWRQLEAGLSQRLKALNRFLADVSTDPRVSLKTESFPSKWLGMSQYRVEMRGVPVPHGTYIAVCGTELVRTNEGFHVLEDNLRVPSGVSYMVANRKAVKTNLRRLYRSCRVREVEHCGGLLRETLRELAPRDQPDPCVFRSDSLLGLPGLMSVYNAGNVTLVNAPGTGVADDKSVYAFVPDMIRYYLDEEPLLQNVKTYICRRPEDLEFTLDNLQNLIVKRWVSPGDTACWSIPTQRSWNGRLRPGSSGKPRRFHLAACTGPVTRSLHDRGAGRGAARGLAPLRAARPRDPHRPGRILPRGAARG